MKLTVGLNCPSCGGRIELEEGSKIAVCPFCHTVTRVEGDEGVKTLAYRMKIDEKLAYRVAYSWFERGFKARDLKKVAKIVEMYPVYLPFWRYSARGMGIVLGYNVVEHIDSNGNVYREKKPKEEVIIKDYDWTLLACDAGDIGVLHLRNLEGEIIPLSEDLPIYEATKSKDDAKDEAEIAIKRWVLREAHIENITFSKAFVIPRDFSLIYYPFWIIRYDYKGKMYFLTVDGVTGRVISGRAPGDPLWQSLAIGAGATIGGAIAGGIVLGGRVGILALIIGILIFGASYMFFRYGSEIVEGDIPKPYSSRKFTKDILKDFGVRI